MEFIDPFDYALAKDGLPAVFTLNHEGVLQFDLVRSRDFRRQNPPPYRKGWLHCVLVDHATSWPQYALITSPNLATRHERASIHQFDAYEDAIRYVKIKKEDLYGRSEDKK